MGRGNEIAREETGTLERAMREEQIRTKYNARYDNAIRTPTNFVCWGDSPFKFGPHLVMLLEETLGGSA